MVMQFGVLVTKCPAIDSGFQLPFDKQKIQVLIYSHAFAPRIGGVQTLVMSLAKGLAGRNTDGMSIQVTVATPTPRGAFDDASLPFAVVRQPSLRQLVRLIRAADVIHLGGPAFLPLIFGLLMGKQVVVEHSVYQSICPNGLLLDERTKTACPGHFMNGRYGQCWSCNAANQSRGKSLALLLFTFPRRWMCKKVARNVVPTAHVGRRVELPRTVTIYHGVPDSPVPPLAEVPSPATAVTFAYVGRLVSEKGLNLLLESARRLHAEGAAFHLKFIGDGPERAGLEAAVDKFELRPRVTFTGYLQGDNMERALAGVTALVMPSIWEETAGLSAMEHMMRSRLVIAADIGGLGELVDGAGLKFPMGDIDALASCMKRVIDDPALAKSLGKMAGERAQDLFGEKRMVAEHLALYRQIVGVPV